MPSLASATLMHPCTSDSMGKIYNRAFALRFGAEILLAPSFSLGLSANGFMYYDLPTPMIFGGLALTVNYVL